MGAVARKHKPVNRILRLRAIATNSLPPVVFGGWRDEKQKTSGVPAGTKVVKNVSEHSTPGRAAGGNFAVVCEKLFVPL